MAEYTKLVVHTDGGARGNPGPAAIGILFSDEQGEKIAEYSEAIGVTTNNVAEYTAVLRALEKAKQMKVEELEFYLDSELVTKQLNQEFKVKNEDLGKLFITIWNLRQGFKNVTFTHVPREENRYADMLVNKALDN